MTHIKGKWGETERLKGNGQKGNHISKGYLENRDTRVEKQRYSLEQNQSPGRGRWHRYVENRSLLPHS